MDSKVYKQMYFIKDTCTHLLIELHSKLEKSKYYENPLDEDWVLYVQRERRIILAFLDVVSMLLENATQIYPFIGDGGYYPINEIKPKLESVTKVLLRNKPMDEEDRKELMSLVNHMNGSAEDIT